MNVLCRGMFVAVLLGFAAAAAVAASVAAGLDARVKVKVQHAPLHRFLEALSSRAKLNFILAEGLEDRKVTAFLNDVTVGEALDALKELAGIGYRRLARGDSYLIAPISSPQLEIEALEDAGPALNRRVSVDLRHAPLSQFLAALSEQTGANFTVDESVAERRVTASLSNVTAREALEIALTLKGLGCRRLRGRELYLIGPGPARGADAAPSEESRRASQQLYLSGVLHFQKGDREKARGDWALALERDPRNDDARAGLERVQKTAP